MPASSLPENFATISHFERHSCPSTAIARDSASSSVQSVRPFLRTSMYVRPGFTASAAFESSVHGVVVQTTIRRRPEETLPGALSRSSAR